MKNKVTIASLVFILLVGLFLRLFNLSGRFIFGVDQAEDMYKFEEIAVNILSGNFNRLPLVGEPGTYFGDKIALNDNYPVYSGVMFLYFITPFALLSQFDPQILIYSFALFNLFGVILIYLVTEKIFGSRAGIISSILYSVNFYMLVYSRAIWTPSPIPILFLITLYVLMLVSINGRFKLIPLLMFLVGLISQFHDSGYIYSAFFLVVILFSRVPVFKKEFLFKSIFFGTLPLVPTILYEIKTGFTLVGTILSSLVSDHSSVGGNFLYEGLKKFWEFAVSANLPLYFNNYYKQILGNAYLAFMLLFSAITFASLILPVFFNKNRFVKVLFLVFTIVFLGVPLAAKIYYRDNYFGLYPLFGTTFSVLGAIPFMIIAFSGALNFLAEKFKKVGSLLTLAILVFLVVTQIKMSWGNVINNGDKKYDYGDKFAIANALGTEVKGTGYALEYADDQSYAEGYEFFYILEKAKAPPPYSYNGKTSKATLFHKYEFGNKNPEAVFAIAGKNNWGQFNVPGWNQVHESGHFRLYRKL